MARITSQKAAQMVGGDQFLLILMAAQRAREISHGSLPKIKTDNGPIITALREIEEGLYTKEDFNEKFEKRKTK
jgi:DNA-directed RNA polymerase omega subunit